MHKRVLSLSPHAEDHAALADILQPWPLYHAARLPTAMRLLRSHEIRIIVCERERDLPSYSWKDLIRAVAASPRPPLVIVTSRHADEHLWAEALNLGAYDVLAKPFVPAEVRRSVGIAFLHCLGVQQPLMMGAGALTA